MLIILIRTFILYCVIIFTVRIMGKRQIGQLQPSELVITLMISQIVVMPIEDKNVPMSATVIPLLTLACLEILSSVLSVKSSKFRIMTQGHPILIIKRGKLEQKQIKKLRLTVDDILEALRKKDIFDISNVEYAYFETDGTVTAQLKSDYRNVSVGDLQIYSQPSEIPFIIIYDGKVSNYGILNSKISNKKIQDELLRHGVREKDVLLMTGDRNGNIYIIKKEKK